jgi:hypothetical protein
MKREREIENELRAYEKRKEKESTKETYYREKKTNRQHATICQSSRNESDVYLNTKQKKT